MQFRILLSFLICFNSFHCLLSQQQEENSLLERADFLMEEFHFEEAIDMLDQAISLNPSQYEAYYKKATCYINQSDFKNAIEELEKAVLIKKDYCEAYQTLGDLYYQTRKARESVQNWELAYKYDTILDNRLSYKLEIISLLDMLNRYVQTKRHIDDARKLAPDLFELDFAEAKYYNEIEKYDKALNLLKKIIHNIEPTEGNEKYFYEYGVALHFNKKYKESIEAFKKADRDKFRIKIRRFSPEFHFIVAESYYQVLAYDLCDEYLNIAIKLAMESSKDLSKFYELKKLLSASKKNKTKDIQIQNKIIRTKKDPAVLSDEYYKLAILQYQNGDYAFAILSSDESLNNNPLNLNALFIKAMSEYKMQKAEDATKLLSKAVRNPQINSHTKVKFNFALGLIYENVEQYALAARAYRSALNKPFKIAAGFELNHLRRLIQVQRIKRQ